MALLTAARWGTGAFWTGGAAGPPPVRLVPATVGGALALLTVVYAGWAAPAPPPDVVENHAVAVPAPAPVPPPVRVGPRAPVTAGLPAEPAQPAELVISSIGVRSRLVDLGRAQDGTLTIPSDFQVAGWYANGPSPGESGGPPAVIAGHVDSLDGPAIFSRLYQLTKGSDVQVRAIDGVVRHFTVYRLASYDKATFPAGEVYAPGKGAELRLITCTGQFDRRARSYRANLVVYASLAVGKK